MAPPKKPVDDSFIDTGHPLMNQVRAGQDMLKRLNAKDEQAEFRLEQEGEWKASLARIASSKDGAMFLRTMLRHNGLFSPKKGQGAERLLKTEGAQAFYLEFIRPFLDKELRKDIE
jgi:hypothetical protein